MVRNSVLFVLKIMFLHSDVSFSCPLCDGSEIAFFLCLKVNFDTVMSPFAVLYAMAQTLVMVSVFCCSRHSLLLPWKTMQIGEPGRTVELS